MERGGGMGMVSMQPALALKQRCQNSLSTAGSFQKQRGQSHSTSCVTPHVSLGMEAMSARPPGLSTRPSALAAAQTWSGAGAGPGLGSVVRG